MELGWPQLAPDKLICFQRFFRSPLQLDAAFDNDLESLELIQSIFPDMVAEDVMDIVALLMVWKESSDRTFKRARRQVADQAMFLPQGACSESVQDVYRRLSQTNVLTLIETHAKKRQRVLRLEAESRAKRADADRKKYSLLLAQVNIDADLPVVALIRTLDDQQQGWIHLFGTRRCNTLKKTGLRPGGRLQSGWSCSSCILVGSFPFNCETSSITCSIELMKVVAKPFLNVFT